MADELDWEFILDDEYETVDLDSLLADPIPIGTDLPSLSDPPRLLEGSPGSGSGSNSDSSAAWLAEAERFLLADDEEEAAGNGARLEDGFFAELFSGEPDGGKDGAAAAPGTDESEGDAETKSKAASAVVDSDDPVSKKRRRQVRNRDSAMKSRERKKLYVKELETKSRFLESECRRLDHMLRFFMAENMVLHQSLQMGGVSGDPAAKQESAVLFVESLLLGSLFWLVTIVSLFLVPSLPSPGQGASRLGSVLAQVAVMVATAASYRRHPDLGLELVTMRRRCRGMRTKMKLDLFLSNSAYA